MTNSEILDVRLPIGRADLRTRSEADSARPGFYKVVSSSEPATTCTDALFERASPPGPLLQRPGTPLQRRLSPSTRLGQSHLPGERAWLSPYLVPRAEGRETQVENRRSSEQGCPCTFYSAWTVTLARRTSRAVPVPAKQGCPRYLMPVERAWLSPYLPRSRAVPVTCPRLPLEQGCPCLFSVLPRS